MNTMSQRFTKLISRIKADRVAIFIDDLDRCQCEFVIELLEGIQTLFRQAPVIFVIAADDRWLHACFEKVYEDLGKHVHEPDRPLGTLFLERVFQFATPVPDMPLPLREAYWRHLLQPQLDGQRSDMEQARVEAREEMARKANEGEVMAAVRVSDNLPFVKQQAMREEAIVRIAAPDVTAQLEHSLQGFVHLLEPNPRSMKRLVNAYSVNRAISTLGHLNIDHGPLALWTILSMRWPVLAEYLEIVPKALNQGIAEDESLQNLLESDKVKEVIDSKDTDARLDGPIIEQCRLLRT